MRVIQDNAYDLAIVDPPYGLPADSSNSRGKMGTRIFNKSNISTWDKAPSPEYFDQLFRVSKNQIIFGGNYFDLPPTRCFVCWDKKQPFENFSQVEYAWTSFNSTAKIFRFDNRTGDKIHPTQKPVVLYKWLLSKFAKPGDSILDTHLGSGSIAIACHDMGFSLTGCEINADYCKKAVRRIREHQQQAIIPFAY